ncbi:hypothetical protein M758_UG260800 [Ceratodon purpureus]|nr:hypothetical protein M758_UG260800 [Ceratodon purpureus]
MRLKWIEKGRIDKRVNLKAWKISVRSKLVQFSERHFRQRLGNCPLFLYLLRCTRIGKLSSINWRRDLSLERTT